jgi:preprotein translocase subunit YajC
MYPLIADAQAQTAAPSGGGFTDAILSSGVGQFLPIILIFVVFYFIILRPQQSEQKRLKARLAAVKKGDRVLTAGGIIGTVQKSRDGAPEIEVEIAPNVRVIVQRDTLVNVLGAAGAEAK